MKVIGIDIGTTSISSVVIDSDGWIQLASKTVANDTAIAGEAWQNMQDADRIFGKCARLIEAYRASWPDISRIGITGQMHGMLYTDDKGLAVSPLTTWQDERGNQMQENGKTYVQELQEKTGCRMATGFGLTTHAYNLKNGLVPPKAQCIVTIMDYVAMRLCGNDRAIMHPSNAASFGLFDIEKGCFDLEACRAAGIDTRMLPEIASSEQLIGRTPDGIEVMIPIGDNQAGIMGLIQDERDIVINVGTSSQISMIISSLPKGSGLKSNGFERSGLKSSQLEGCELKRSGLEGSELEDGELKGSRLEYRPYVGGKYLVLGAGLCGGISFSMLNEFFKMVAEGLGAKASKEAVFHYMTEEAEKIYEQVYEQDADLQVCTQFRGTRLDPSLRGSIEHISMTNFTPGNLVLGFYRGVLSELYEAYQKMESVSEEGRILLCGNAFRNSPLLRQLCQDMFQRDVVLSDQKEETATGAAKLAIVSG